MHKPQTIVRQCKHHGESEYVLEVRKTKSVYRCKQCRNDNVTNARRRLRAELVEAAGGRCVRCGYDRSIWALHFHHEGSDKVDAVSVLIRNGRRADARSEALKCILICANCHAEEHASLTQ